ncbi:DUF1778 domain-containing protein [Pelagicoccus enzymogenes]|uniref:type II toxin-antitoxin system TacA family antitoxin n=1 Tax=Pelagicoccus TaxID=455433 RepID=UPI00280D1728|nr:MULTISPECIES: DUF1778 domain-containing protein [Pelagicoccus]MDQ8182587.1 DUF1778 domain-containing protein [Pelagicoccus sp. SDUM812005]MDQ8197469.1 DUF1778 domain-containing protein [Pelagicoccus enzymogenes]
MTYKMVMKAETERLATRIRPEDKQLIEQAAALSGVSVSAFVKMRLREAALQVIDQERQIKLNAEESLKFAEALLAPPRELPAAFKKAMELYDSMVEER